MIRLSVRRFTGRHLTVHSCALLPRCSLALWTLRGHAYIPVRGHSLPDVLAPAPFGPSWSGIAGALGRKTQWVQAWSGQCVVRIQRTGGGGGWHDAFGVMFSSAAGGAHWQIAIRCPSLPFPSVKVHQAAVLVRRFRFSIGGGGVQTGGGGGGLA